MKIYKHIPHPYIESRTKKHVPPPAKTHKGPLARCNTFLAEMITKSVGTMWCAYVFALICFISLPEALHTGTGALINWLAQSFLQLVLLSIIMVGQKVGDDAEAARAEDTYKDVEAILYEALEIHNHLAAQDALLQKLVERRSSSAKLEDKNEEKDHEKMQ